MKFRNLFGPIAAFLLGAALLVQPAFATDTNYSVLNSLVQVKKDMGDGTVADRVVVVNGTGVVAPAGTSADPQAVVGVSGGQPFPNLGCNGTSIISTSNPLCIVPYTSAGIVMGTMNTTYGTFAASSTINAQKVVAIASAYDGSSNYKELCDILGAAGTGDCVLATATSGAAFSNITTATTTTVKSGAGIVQSIVVNTPAAGVITGYCNTAASGTKFATITTIASTQPFTITYNTYCTTGITIVTSVVMDLTVNYR